jgi:hypothetical protein
MASLIDANMRELAALVVDGELSIQSGNWGGDQSLLVDLPTSALTYVTSNERIRKDLERTLAEIANGHLFDQNGNPVTASIEFRVKLLDLEPNWRAVVKDLIINSKDANQGVVTEKVFLRQKRSIFVYNEMKFASQSEIRVAQELERRQVLFFPLPLAVRHETGELYQDHREVDFLVCCDGGWGILEVAYHPGRYEQDSEKDHWFKRSGILCIQHYTAERCFRETEKVVDDFLSVLGKHRK